MVSQLLVVFMTSTALAYGEPTACCAQLEQQAHAYRYSWLANRANQLYLLICLGILRYYGTLQRHFSLTCILR